MVHRVHRVVWAGVVREGGVGVGGCGESMILFGVNSWEMIYNKARCPPHRCVRIELAMELRHGQRHGGSAVGTHVHAYAVADVPSSGNMPASRGPGRNPPLFEASNQNKMTTL